MNKKHSQLHTDDANLNAVLAELAAAPDDAVVTTSFNETMEVVTNTEQIRILHTTKKDVSALSIQSIMTNLTKTVLVAVPTLAVVLLVGYNTLEKNGLGQYEDIMQAALEDEYAYAPYEADYGDLLEVSSLEDDLDLVSHKTEAEEIVTNTPAVTSSSGSEMGLPVEEVQEATVALEETLQAIDDIFLEDDIDDSELNAWFADDLAGDALFDSYDI